MFQTPVAEWVGKSVVIGVRATGPKGKVSGWSNLRPVSVDVPLTRPASIRVENVARGVGVTWQGSGPRYRVLRATEKGPLVLLGDTEPDLQGYNVYRSMEGGPFEKIGSLVQTPVFSDNRVESGKRYRYAISSVDLADNESARSAPIEVVAP